MVLAESPAPRPLPVKNGEGRDAGACLGTIFRDVGRRPRLQQPPRLFAPGRSDNFLGRSV